MNDVRLIPELKVRDFTKSLSFYLALAGFVVLFDRPEEDFAMLEREGARIMIEALDNNTRNWSTGQLDYPFGRGMNLQIEVSDVRNLYDNFKRNNYPIFFELEEKWYRKNEKEVGNQQFLVQDPDGYLLRFFQSLGERQQTNLQG